MRRVLLFLFLSLALVACGNTAQLPQQNDVRNALLRNPLYAEYYYDDLTQQMVNLALKGDPILNEPRIQQLVDRTRNRSLEHANEAIDAQFEGSMGLFISERELVGGEVLVHNNTLYFGPNFNAAPGPSLEVFLTTVLDPRDAEFPDDSAVNLGLLQNQYGTQSVSIPDHPRTGTGRLKTVVLWDTELDLLYGFAQLEKRIL